MKKNYPYFGVLAAITYIFTVLIGAAVYPGYSHLVNAISELTSPGAPHKALLDGMFSIYNVLLLGFGIFLFIYPMPVKKTTIKIAGILLALIGLAGLLMYEFPMDARGTVATLRGSIHWVLAGVLSLSTFLSEFMVGFATSNIPSLKKIHVFSLLLGCITFLSGIVTAIGAQMQFTWFGLIERVTIGSFILWVLVFSLNLLRLNKQVVD
jgi:hypothetical membrane protein